jgi:hypothetical protein
MTPKRTAGKMPALLELRKAIDQLSLRTQRSLLGEAIFNNLLEIAMSGIDRPPRNDRINFVAQIARFSPDSGENPAGLLGEAIFKTIISSCVQSNSLCERIDNASLWSCRQNARPTGTRNTAGKNTKPSQ